MRWTSRDESFSRRFFREFAGIEKEAVLVGVGSRIEIWSREKWTAANTFDDMEEIAEHMEGLGI